MKPGRFRALVFALLPCAFAGARGEDEARLPLQYRDKPFAVDYATELDIWVAGDFGLLLASADGGGTWRRVESPTTQALLALSFPERQRGWAVGSAGTVLATRDGGATWQVQESGVSEDLLAVHFKDRERGFAVGQFATFLETRDGGRSWRQRQLVEGSVAEEDWEGLEMQVFTSPLLNDIFFVDPSHGWIVGEYGVVYATEDGGDSWQDRSTGQQAILFSVAFRDARRGMVVGLGGLILYTNDGGRSWSPAHPVSSQGSSQGPSREALYHVALHPTKGENAVVVGDAGTLLWTQDGGQSWSVPRRGPGAVGWLRGVASPDGERFLAVGTHGVVLASGDGGASWTRVP